MDIETNIKLFESEMAKIDKSSRPGVDALMDYIRNSDMYTAPSSTRFHLSVKGGLLQHSLNVLKVLRSLLHDNGDGTYSYLVCGEDLGDAYRVSEDSVIIIALLHDICKTRFYKEEERWRKDENGQWERYSTYSIDDKSPLGHGEKSALMIQQFMPLKPVELYAIRWHMGFSDDNTNTFSKAVDLFPIIWAVHSADMMATHFIETENIV